MTLQELKQGLEGTGLPVVYHSFKKAPTPPYLVYLFSYSDDLMADNENYLEVSNFQVELYTKIKDPVTERLVEGKLKELELTYQKRETYIKSEELFQILYLVQIIGG